MAIIEIKTLDAPELAVFANLTGAQLRNRLEPEKGVFIAESPKVIHRALDAGFRPVSILTERKHIEGQGREIIEICKDIPVYTADSNLLSALTGYPLTRGVLCAMRRRPLPALQDLLKDAKRVAVLEGIVEQYHFGVLRGGRGAELADAMTAVGIDGYMDVRIFVSGLVGLVADVVRSAGIGGKQETRTLALVAAA